MSETLYKVVITPFAEAALQATYGYIRLELLAEQAADDWLDLMEREIFNLFCLPGRYPLVRREPWHSEGIHVQPVKGYNIYYWINEEQWKVFVIDVVNHRIQQDKRLTKSTQSFRQTISEQ
ncbi:MAG: type II toxin-antitoxin system RelE/ParE family toxin [Clostridia bacterium]|nr:type II toxin-antitoxin system RelE/ParE family toxin [Clostridia bacterium]